METKANDQLAAEAAFESQLQPASEEAILDLLSQMTFQGPAMYAEKLKKYSALHPPRVACVVAMREVLAESLSLAAWQLSHDKYHRILSGLVELEELVMRPKHAPDLAMN